MNSILEQYQKQVQSDRVEETYHHDNAENNLQMTDEEYEYYKQTIDDLREQMYENIPKEMSSRVVNKSYPKSLIEKETEPDKFAGDVTDTDNNGEHIFNETKVYKSDELETRIEEIHGNLRLAIKHAKCPLCGNELESAVPTMYNPFNFEPLTPIKCKHCGGQYTVDYAYPRLVVLDDNNNEVKVNWY